MALTKLVHVEAVLAWGEAGHLSSDLDLLSFDLHEFGAAIDARVAVLVEHADCVVRCSFDHLSLLLRFPL